MTIQITIVLFYVLVGVSVEEHHLARAIQGERPDLVCSSILDSRCQHLSDSIGQVVINRLEANWCDSIQECVDSGFWGAQNVNLPDSWAIESARRVLQKNEVTSSFYVFSIPDTEKLGLSLSDSLFYVLGNGSGLVFYDRKTTW